MGSRVPFTRARSFSRKFRWPHMRNGSGFHQPDGVPRAGCHLGAQVEACVQDRLLNGRPARVELTLSRALPVHEEPMVAEPAHIRTNSDRRGGHLHFESEAWRLIARALCVQIALGYVRQIGISRDPLSAVPGGRVEKGRLKPRERRGLAVGHRIGHGSARGLARLHNSGQAVPACHTPVDSL